MTVKALDRVERVVRAGEVVSGRKGRSRGRMTVVIMAALAGFGLIVVGTLMFRMAGSPSVAQAKAAGTAKTDAKKVPAGPAQAEVHQGFTLMFTGNWEGRLEPCGCAEKMLGGIDRRTQILTSVAPASRLLLDAGSLIEDVEDRQSQLKFQTFFYSLRQLNYDAMALTASEHILNEALQIDAAERPTLICTNMGKKKQESLGTATFLEKTLTFEDHKLDCLVLAVPAADLPAEEAAHAELELSDPVSAIKATLSQQGVAPDEPSGDKLVIVMLAKPGEELVESLRLVPALDMVVRMGYSDDPAVVSKAGENLVVVTTGRLGKFLTRIDLPADSDSTAAGMTLRAIAIEDHFEKDPQILELMQEYLDLLESENLLEGLARAPLEGGNSFVGSAACKGCHAAEYEKWEEMAHSRAIDILEEKGRLFDPECIACHTVGMKYEGGYVSLDTTPNLAAVGCEMCHGPGYLHLQDQTEPYLELFNKCAQCHDHENSPTFEKEYEEYFKKIKHWFGSPRAKWHP